MNIRFLILLLICFCALTTRAQNNSNALKAQIEYEDAELAFQNKEYKIAINKLTTVENLLGKWHHKTAYLKIIALDKTVDYAFEWDSNLQDLYNQIKQYMKYAESNKDAVDIDKLREIYAVEKKISIAKKMHDFLLDPDYKTGMEAYKNKQYDVAFQYLEKAAKYGNTRAMDNLCDMYRKGVGVKSNYAKALEWDNIRLATGDPVSALYVGHVYARGSGVDKNYTKALAYYEKGIDYNIREAFKYIANLYYSGGYGIEQDYSAALNYYKKSAEFGDTTVYNKLGEMYYSGLGVEKRYKTAMDWFQKAVDHKDYIAAGYIGTIYFLGSNEIEKDHDKTLWWFNKSYEYKSSDIEDPSLYFMLANAYLIIKNDYKESMKWYLRAHNAGHKKAKVKIAELYERGLGVEKDKKLAKQWRNK